MPTVGRNSACPCGSGKKAKKCHADLVGMSVRVAAWFLSALLFFENAKGFLPPMDDDGRKAWKSMGCPHGVCDHGTIPETGGCAAPNCGV